MVRIKKLFQVIEHSSHFVVRHIPSGWEKAMGDGVDTLFTKTGKAKSPGAKGFRADWERALNADKADVLEAYFPEIGEE